MRPHEKEHKLYIADEAYKRPVHSEYLDHLPFAHALSNHPTFISQVGRLCQDPKVSKHMSKLSKPLGEVEKTSQKI